jgi:hypothetical protein
MSPLLSAAVESAGEPFPSVESFCPADRDLM